MGFSNDDGVRRGWGSRWAAIGAAVAVSFGAGGFFIAEAASGPESSTVMVDPVRILDTRDPVDIGLAGPFVSAVSQKLQVTGSIPTTTGTQIVVPAGATGVLLNVTAVAATANGFISIRSGDATGSPSTSSLNVTAGVTVPNAVQVGVPLAGANAGKIDITWDALGIAGPTTDMLIDVVGYTTNTELTALQQELDALQIAQPRIQTSVVGEILGLVDGQSIATVTITVPGTVNQNVHITGNALLFGNSVQGAACTVFDICNASVVIHDADANTQVSAGAGGGFRYTYDYPSQTAAVSVVVSATPGTHTYRMETMLSSNLNPGALSLENATLTAMTIPLTGTGGIPLLTGGAAPLTNATGEVGFNGD